MDDSIKSKIYYPMLVSNKGTNEPLTKEEDTLIWKKYLTLSQENKNILTSYELPRKVKELQNKYSLSDVVLGQISLSLRKIFFGEMDMARFTTLLTQVEGNTGKVTEIIQFIDKEILHLIPKIPLEEVPEDVTEKKEVAVVKLPLLRAITQYENLGQQSLTNEKIKIKSQPEPQRPSLANWIRYYRDELGIGFHDQVSRGRFLFQSENGKRLSNEERERINLVLKSIEEDFPLDIDTEHQTIVFPVRTQAPSPQAPSSRPLFSPREAVPTRPVKPYEPNQQTTVNRQPSSGVPQGVPSPVLSPPQAKPSFLATKLSPQKNVAGETLHFSTGHVLPGEQAKSVPSERPATESTPPTAPGRPTQTPSFHPKSLNQNRGVSLPRSPYSIRPLRMRSNEGGEQGENA